MSLFLFFVYFIILAAAGLSWMLWHYELQKRPSHSVSPSPSLSLSVCESGRARPAWLISLTNDDIFTCWSSLNWLQTLDLAYSQRITRHPDVCQHHLCQSVITSSTMEWLLVLKRTLWSFLVNMFTYNTLSLRPIKCVECIYFPKNINSIERDAKLRLANTPIGIVESLLLNHVALCCTKQLHPMAILYQPIKSATQN